MGQVIARKGPHAENGHRVADHLRSKSSTWPSKAAAELARGAHIVPYDKRSAIFHAGETADLVYILLSGEVKLQFDADDGSSLLVSIARGGQMLGVFAPGTGPISGARPRAAFHRACAVSLQSGDHSHGAGGARAPPSAGGATGAGDGTQPRAVDHLCCRLLSFMTMNVRQRLTHAIAEIADSFGVADARGRMITLALVA